MKSCRHKGPKRAVASKRPQVGEPPDSDHQLLVQNGATVHSPTNLSSRPERSRSSCHAAPDKAACAPFRKERRMKFANAIKFHRKSGGAQWRDLRFLFRFSRTLLSPCAFCRSNNGFCFHMTKGTSRLSHSVVTFGPVCRHFRSVTFGRQRTYLPAPFPPWNERALMRTAELFGASRDGST